MNAPAPMLRGTLRRGEPLARHTTWRVGGPAALFYRPADLEDLGAFLRTLDRAMPVLWLGLGSNLLVRDGGFRGAVIATAKALTGLAVHPDGAVDAQAGVPCAQLAQTCARGGLAGGEFLAGVPGTVGGALAMNAGAHGGETWKLVAHVDVMDRAGAVHRRAPGAYAIGYRAVRGPAPDEWFVAARLRCVPADPAAVAARVRALLRRRAQTQPLRRANAGSVFRNPPGDYAARLIEAAGLKGRTRGGAQVSTLHANFIVNLGGATAADIEALIAEVRDAVHARSGIALEPEVRVVGEAA
jgi:UDP-N-acetylmuramate dehydrogenase